MGDRLGRGRHEAPIILEDPEKVTLGFALRAWRRSQDLTPTDLAEKAGFGRTGRAYVSKLEHGKIKKPTDLSLRRLTTALGISNETLLTLQLPPNFSIESIPTRELDSMGLLERVQRLERTVERLARIIEGNAS